MIQCLLLLIISMSEHPLPAIIYFTIILQINQITSENKFEKEIKDEMEEKKRLEEEKKQRKAAFKEKATVFQQHWNFLLNISFLDSAIYSKVANVW